MLMVRTGSWMADFMLALHNQVARISGGWVKPIGVNFCKRMDSQNQIGKGGGGKHF